MIWALRCEWPWAVAAGKRGMRWPKPWNCLCCLFLAPTGMQDHLAAGCESDTLCVDPPAGAQARRCCCKPARPISSIRWLWPCRRCRPRQWRKKRSHRSAPSTAAGTRTGRPPARPPGHVRARLYSRVDWATALQNVSARALNSLTPTAAVVSPSESHWRAGTCCLACDRVCPRARAQGRQGAPGWLHEAGSGGRVARGMEVSAQRPVRRAACCQRGDETPS